MRLQEQLLEISASIDAVATKPLEGISESEHGNVPTRDNNKKLKALVDSENRSPPPRAVIPKARENNILVTRKKMQKITEIRESWR